VRSEQKASFVRELLGDLPVVTVVAAENTAVLEEVRRFYGSRGAGSTFRGFDDVIVAAGDAGTIAAAHELLAPTGARLMAFAGTRGACTVESGVWHYANAGVIGTSGCNTRMMDVALGLFARGSLDPSRLVGRRYTFDDLAKPGGVEAFFADKRLRPCVEPNATT
jgi:threonine dehydrogenase-like Zn-dependent dehydrogenase